MALQTSRVSRIMSASSRNPNWSFLSSGTSMKKLSNSVGMEESKDEELVLPSLKRLVNRNAVAMQMPNMTRKYAVSKAPLIPSFLLGKLEVELLEYPELPTREEVAQVNSLFSTVEDYMTKRVDSKLVDEQASIPSSLLADCKVMGLFGQRADPKYGGLGMTAVESTLVGEAMSYDPSLFATITVHEALGMKGLQLVGTEAQKAKYLAAMATGEKIAAFCLAESPEAAFPTRTTLAPDRKNYVLNGRKAWVVNGSCADVFTVFALTPVTDEKGETTDKLSAFLVERSFEGSIEAEPVLERTGLRGLNLANVTFKDVKVPVENLLGALGSGAELSGKVACMDRYLVGGLCIGLTRDVLDALTEHCCLRHRGGRTLAQLGIVQHRLAHAAAQIYAMESITYMVAGLLTAQPERDLSIESSAVKLFVTETTLDLLNNLTNLAGAMGFTKKLPLERYLRDARVLTSFLGVNDMLRAYIASSALSIAGKDLREFAERARDPKNNMLYMLREVWRRDRRRGLFSRSSSAPTVVTCSLEGGGETERGIKPSTYVRDHLHPNLRPLADRLSLMVIRTHEIVQQALIHHANTVSEDQFTLRMVADAAVSLFTVTAVLSRASRAKSIGVRSHNNELELAELYSMDTLDKLEAELSNYKRKDNLSKRISNVMVKEGGYASVSPLSRVW